MDDFGMLARDFGFKPSHDKSAPMAPSRANVAVRSDGGDQPAFFDVFGGPPKYSSTKADKSADYESIFRNSSAANDSKQKKSSLPVYDKPVYDDGGIDIFEGLPGLKSNSTSSPAGHEGDIFEGLPGLKSKSTSSSVRYDPPKQRDQVDELLGNFSRTEKVASTSNKSSSSRSFDDLLPGFGSSSLTGTKRPSSESSQTQKPTVSSNQSTSNVMGDPFVDLGSTSTPVRSSTGLFTDPLEEISKRKNSESTKVDSSSVDGGVFDDIDPLNGFGKSVPAFSAEKNNREKNGSPSRKGSNMRGTQTSASEEPVGNYSFRNSESGSQEKMPVNSFVDFNQTLFDAPAASAGSHKSVGQTISPSSVHINPIESTSQIDMSPRSEETVEHSDDVWLTVSEVPLFTQPTRAPPPSRPPPVPSRATKSYKGSFASYSRRKVNDFSASQNSSQYSESPKLFRPTPKSPEASQIDELEDFAMGKIANVDERSEFHSGDGIRANTVAAASAAAMKEAMDRAEAKFRHAKEIRDKDYAKAARNNDAVQLERDEQALQDAQERDFRENKERLDRERRQREKEEREREERRLEKERERQMARQAVERANREARERAAAEARLKAERTAVEKANSEVRERAERAAVQRAQNEARERAAAEARERAERAAAEARERANAEAREKGAREKAKAEAETRRRAERAAVEKAAAEARERAASVARDRAASAARVNLQKDDNDLESFFSMGSRPSSAPRPRANPPNPVVDPQFQNRGGPEPSRKTSSVGVRKASSTTNIVDDLSSIFGAAPSSGDFQDVEGESEERRRARLERHQRTQERAAKALAEKNQRDLQSQREQQERHRIAETLDIEIKRWAAGKEGNLRALLSTMQYVLWPECGWQPVSLTDLITGASVKKVYRKATLCIHPDKVQQKGANLQQKYIAEKVFDLLKEAWNKFNSEELF